MVKKRKFVPEDLYHFQFVSDPQISPSCQEVLFVKSRIDEKREGYASNIYLYNIKKQEEVPFTQGAKSDTRPRWSPCGHKIAFISGRKDKKQLYLLPRQGGEAYPLVEFKYGVGDLVWSPDGKKLAFTAQCELEEDVEQLLNLDSKADEKKGKEAIVIDNIKYKADGVGLAGSKKSHIFVVDAEGGKPVKITEGDYSHSTPVWSPCGGYLAFSSNRTPEPEYSVNISDIWVVAATGGELQQVTDGQGRYYSPAFSWDAKYLAFLGHDNAYMGATLTRLHIRDMISGDVRCLTQAFDYGLGASDGGDMKMGAPTPGPIWEKNSQYLFVNASLKGQTHLFKVDAKTGEVSQLSQGNQQIIGYSIGTCNERAAIVYSDASQPGDLAVLDLVSGQQHRCTSVNDKLLTECYVAPLEEIKFTSVDDWEVQGWIIKPIGFKEGVKYPLVLEIHGGPHSMYASNFFFEFQLLAAAGNVVLYTNPRGSAGYRQEFVNAVRGDYGGKDYEDLMNAVDYACTLPYVDADRLGVTGGSYGGFMTNWIVGHTDRFKAAVTQRSICNWVSFYGVSDIGYFFTEGEIGDSPWGNMDKLLKHSPMSYVEQVDTPLLILHGEQDMRCPIEQGEQFYVFLKRLKKKVQFVRFPGADHNLSRAGHPQQRVERLMRIINWFSDHMTYNLDDYTTNQ